jgi:hypothetical protein
MIWTGCLVDAEVQVVHALITKPIEIGAKGALKRRANSYEIAQTSSMSNYTMTLFASSRLART